MAISHFFPTSIYRKPLTTAGNSTLAKQLLFEAYQFRNSDQFGQDWCKKNYPGGYTSYASLPALDQLSPTFRALRKHLDRHITSFSKHLEMDINPKELKLSSLWINIMPPMVSHSLHIHPLSSISGTYYVQTPKNCSSIKFEDPRLVAFMASPPRKIKARPENQRFISLQPKVGDLILFESWIRHEVPPNLSKSDRISISFNYDW